MELHAETAVMLREAREYIEMHGWVKGTMRNYRGNVCMLQALQSVNGVKHGPAVKEQATLQILRLTGTATIPTFNDAQHTTKDDVCDVLRAAEQCEKELAS